MSYEYEDRIIAYIDILAFSEKIKITENEEKEQEAKQMLNNLTKAVTFLNEKIQSAIENIELPEGTKTSMFSDNIVISIPKAESNGVLHLFELLKELQIQLMSDSILLRGAVVHGKLVHTDKLIIGPALINAYNVESKSAVYPRIVIDPHVLNLFVREHGESNGNNKIRDYDFHLTFQKDFDGTSYIDYFNSIDEYAPMRDTKRYFKLMNELIKKGLKNKRDTGIRMKYMWMREKVKYANYLQETKFP